MTSELSPMKFMTLIKPYSFENNPAEPPDDINARIQNILSLQPTAPQNQDDNSTLYQNSSNNLEEINQTIHKNIKIIEYLLFQLATQKINKPVLPIDEAKIKRNELYLTFLNLMNSHDQIYTKNEAEQIFTKIKDIYEKD